MSLISVCIPCYNGEWCIEKAIKSVMDQTHKSWEILISVDLSTDNSKSLCQKYENTQGFRVFYQDIRLGWVRNCNFLLKKARGDYVCLLPCDDYINSTYLEKLLSSFISNPNAIVCYGRIECVGDLIRPMRQKSITKCTPLQRMTLVIERYMSAISFRGLINRNKIITTPYLYYLREDHHDNMYADTTWILQQAIVGTLIENTEAIYFKNFHKTNEHSGWAQKSLPDRILAWVRHCALLFKIGSQVYPDKHEIILRTCINRYLNPKIGSLSKDDVALHIEVFYNECKLCMDLSNKIISSNLNLPNVMLNKKNAIVLGAGFQGCCIALMLRKYGFNVMMVDQCADIMTRASMNQEGKIHLGFVYSLDKSFQTSETMLEGALNFSHYMEYLLETKIDWNSMKSEPFYYLVPKSSLLNPEEIEKCFEKIQDKYEQSIALNPHLSYLGSKPKTLFKRVSLPEKVDHEFFCAAFETEEIAISQRYLKPLIRNALEKQGVKMVFNHRIDNIKRFVDPETLVESGFEITSNTNNFLSEPDKHEVIKNTIFRSDYIFNCFWEGRTLIDKQIGTMVSPNTNIRFKFGIISDYLESLEGIPSCTIVQGPFGDFVRFNKEDRMYFSWYPSSMRGMIVGDTIPPEWNNYASGILPQELKTDLLQSHKNKFQQLFKTDFDFCNPYVVGGMIVANGTIDIDHSDSELHIRSNPVITPNGANFYSISTNKFTSAPLNAFLLERQYIQKLSCDTS